MKILLANKYHYLRGGAESHVFQLAQLLEEKGHEVMHFSMHHPDNFAYKHDNYFVPYIDFMQELNKKGLPPKIKVLKNIIYSESARKNFSDALDFFRPDVIHLHNIHRHLTISILYEARKRKIPVVWTLHDYNLICPNYLMLSHGKICERCKNRNYLAPIKEVCVKDSMSASAISALVKFLNDMQGMSKMINAYISPSKFLKEKFDEFRYVRSDIKVLPNFYHIGEYKKSRPLGRYFLYLGRLSQEKGIATLCEAAAKAEIKLVIAGEGPMKESLSRYSSDKIKFVGYKKGRELAELRKNAWFVIVPSEWYENGPYSIIESFSDGVPVIGSRIGGIPEMVIDGKTGFLFEPGDIGDLARVFEETKKMSLKDRDALGKAGHGQVAKENSPSLYYENLIKIYNDAINSPRK